MNEQQLFEQALSLRDSGDLTGALSVLERLRDSRAESAALFAILGAVCWDLGEREKAADSFRRGTLLSPGSDVPSLGLFHCLWELGRREEALAEARRFLSVADSEDYREILAELGEKAA